MGMSHGLRRAHTPAGAFPTGARGVLAWLAGWHQHLRWAAHGAQESSALTALHPHLAQWAQRGRGRGLQTGGNRRAAWPMQGVWRIASCCSVSPWQTPLPPADCVQCLPAWSMRPSRRQGGPAAWSCCTTAPGFLHAAVASAMKLPRLSALRWAKSTARRHSSHTSRSRICLQLQATSSAEHHNVSATALCGVQLGLGNAGCAVPGSAFGPGNGTSRLQTISCTGTEPSWEACRSIVWSAAKCSAAGDAAISCVNAAARESVGKWLLGFRGWLWHRRRVWLPSTLAHTAVQPLPPHAARVRLVSGGITNNTRAMQGRLEVQLWNGAWSTGASSG